MTTNQDTPVAWLFDWNKDFDCREVRFDCRIDPLLEWYKPTITPLYSSDQIDRMRQERDQARELAKSMEAEANQMREVSIINRHRAERAEELLAEAISGLEFYANPEIYRPHPHGLAFDRRDLSFHARTLLTKLQDTNHE